MSVAIGEVFLERRVVVVGGGLKRAVVIHCRHCICGVALQRKLKLAGTM